MKEKINFYSIITISSIFLLIFSCQFTVEKSLLSFIDQDGLSLQDIDNDGDGFCKQGYENHNLCPKKGVYDCNDFDFHITYPSGTRILWDEHPNHDGDLSGFRIYQEIASSQDVQLIDIPNPYSNGIALSSLNIDPCSRSTIYVLAYDWSGNESDPSPSFCWGVECP